MAQLEKTTREGEESFSLKQWLKQWKLESIEESLRAEDVNIHELCEYGETDLRSIANENLGLSGLKCARFIKAVMSLNDYKGLTNTSIVFIGPNERKIMDTLTQNANKLNQSILFMQRLLSDLQNTKYDCEASIDTKCDEIVSQVEKTRIRLKSLLKSEFSSLNHSLTTSLDEITNEYKSVTKSKEKCNIILSNRDKKRTEEERLTELQSLVMSTEMVDKQMLQWSGVNKPMLSVHLDSKGVIWQTLKSGMVLKSECEMKSVDEMQSEMIIKWSALHKSERISLTNDCYKATYNGKSKYAYIISDEMVMRSADSNVHCWRLKVFQSNTSDPWLSFATFINTSDPWLLFGITCFDKSGKYENRNKYECKDMWCVNQCGYVMFDGKLNGRLSCKCKAKDIIVDFRLSIFERTLHVKSVSVSNGAQHIDYTMTGIDTKREPFVPYVNMAYNKCSVQIAKITPEMFGNADSLKNISFAH